MLNYPLKKHKEYYNDNLQNTLRCLFHVIWRFNKSWLIDLIYFDIWTLYTLVVNLLFRPFQRCTDSTLSFFLHCVNMPHPKVIYAFGNYFWNLGRIDGKLGISCSLSAWHCNGFLMGCWAWLNALLDPAAVWWGMRFRFLAVWLRLQKRSGREKQKNQWALSGYCQSSEVLQCCQVMWHDSRCALVWHPNAPAAERRAGWQASQGV